MSNSQRGPHLRKLNSAAEFRAVLAGSCRLSSRGFVLRASANNLEVARLGLVAGRKAARRAVDRNRAKRFAREAFFKARTIMPPIDVVLQLKNDLRRSGNAAVRAELENLLRNLRARWTGQADVPRLNNK